MVKATLPSVSFYYLPQGSFVNHYGLVVVATRQYVRLLHTTKRVTLSLHAVHVAWVAPHTTKSPANFLELQLGLRVPWIVGELPLRGGE